MTLSSFNASLDAYLEEDIPEAVDKLMRSISLQALSGLVLKTPVDTGRARANWQVSIGTAIESDTEDLDTSGGTAISKGSTVISQGLSGNPFQTIFIQNNLPYIEALEDGHSQQAPGGMLTVTVAEIESQFR